MESGIQNFVQREPKKHTSHYHQVINTFWTVLLLMGCSNQIATNQPSSLETPPEFIPTKPGHITEPIPTINSTPIDDLPIETLSQITIGLMGDLSLGRKVNSAANSTSDYDLFSDPQTEVFLQKNDLNIANFESSIPGVNDNGIALCPITGNGNLMILCGDEKFVPYISQHNFILNLANNHIDDFNMVEGEQKTKDVFDTNNVDYYNSHNPDAEFIEKEINGVKVGFLGFDFINHFPGHNEASKQEVIDRIKKYDNKVDYLVVSVHWGQEYESKQSKTQEEFAHAFIDAGADIIHGTHPHVVQPMEMYKDKPIFYSLGNFVFDQDHREDTNHSSIYQVVVSKNSVLEVTEYEIEIASNGKPKITSPPNVVFSNP